MPCSQLLPVRFPRQTWRIPVENLTASSPSNFPVRWISWVSLTKLPYWEDRFRLYLLQVLNCVKKNCCTTLANKYYNQIVATYWKKDACRVMIFGGLAESISAKKLDSHLLAPSIDDTSCRGIWKTSPNNSTFGQMPQGDRIPRSLKKKSPQKNLGQLTEKSQKKIKHSRSQLQLEKETVRNFCPNQGSSLILSETHFANNPEERIRRSVWQKISGSTSTNGGDKVSTPFLTFKLDWGWDDWLQSSDYTPIWQGPRNKFDTLSYFPLQKKRRDFEALAESPNTQIPKS